MDLDDSLDENQDAKLSLRLVGRLVSDKTLTFDALKRTMLHVWSLKDGVIIRAMDKIYLCSNSFTGRIERRCCMGDLSALNKRYLF